MENTNTIHNNPVTQANDEEIDLGRIIYLLLQKWPWFVIGLFLTLAAAFCYNHYFRQQAYTIDTSILVKPDDNDLNLGNVFENSILPGRSKVTPDNEIELLKSFTLARGVFEKLNWRTSWYEYEFFRQKGLYPDIPFIVQENGNLSNTEGLLLKLDLHKDSSYTLTADGKATINQILRKVKFRQEGKLGEPFQNDFFDFTLYPNNGTELKACTDYYFRFNNINTLTKSYLGKQQIASASKTSDVIRLSIEGNDPMREIHYLNGLVSEYINQNLEIRTETKKRSLDFINKQLSGISDSLYAAGSTVTQFRSENQAVDIGAQGSLVMQQLAEIEKERAQSQMQLDYFRNLLSYIDNSDSIKNMVIPSVVGVQDPSLSSMVVRLSELYSRRAVLSFSTHENNPSLLLLNEEIEQVTSQLKENLANLISNAQLNIRNQQQREASINQQLNNLPVKEQQLINITRQYELTSEIYTYLLQKQAESSIALASTVSNVQVIDPARVERITPSGISSRMIYLLALLLGLALPAVLIIGLDMLNNTIHFQEDVEKLSPLTIIGNVPHSAIAKELVVTENPRAPITESYRTIRTNLQYMLDAKDQQVIGIHSIQTNEGKSFNAMNLASILALNDKKVLLIGADMRKPRLHQAFRTDNKSGLSTYLIGQSGYEEVIRETAVDKLWLLVSGPTPPNPAELLERPAFNALLERARKEFDFIVIDNAPVSMVTDGLVTSRLSDLNIIVLRYGLSRKDQLKYINNMAAKQAMSHPALVINDIKTNRYGYGYGYGYHSYSYYSRYGYYYSNEHQESRYRKFMRKLRKRLNG